MTLVAVCSSAGSSGATTLATLLAAMAPAGLPTLALECDPSGGDLAAWAQLPSTPGWSSAVAQGDRSLPALLQHAQPLPFGLRALLAPPRGFEARTAVQAAASSGFADLFASLPDLIAFADCGRCGFEVPAWVPSAQLTLLVMRQSAVSPLATAALVERTAEAFELLRPASRQIGVVLIGTGPYSPDEVSAALGAPLFGVVPENRSGAGFVAGGWSLRRADRSPLAKAAAVLSEQVAAALYAPRNGHAGPVGARRG